MSVVLRLLFILYRGSYCCFAFYSRRADFLSLPLLWGEAPATAVTVKEAIRML